MSERLRGWSEKVDTLEAVDYGINLLGSSLDMWGPKIIQFDSELTHGKRCGLRKNISN